MVPNWEQLGPPGEIWQCQKTFLVVTMGQGVLLARVEARNVLQCTGKPYHCLQQNITQPQVSLVSRLRNPELVLGSTELP